MFSELLLSLRKQGVKVGLHELLALQQALKAGLITSLDELYGLGRALMIKDVAHFDAWDLAFAEVFSGIEAPARLTEELLQWLQAGLDELPQEPQPDDQPRLSPEELDALFRETLNKQTERHDGGNRWVGTRGRSPFGSGGQNPNGKQVAQGGGRSAVSLAQDRRYQGYRQDRTLDIRQAQVALKRLRRLERRGEEELDLDETIGATARNGGEIDLAFRPERKNQVKLLLMMDAGGSMTPYAHLAEWLFSAAGQGRHWKRFTPLYFHNCVYSRVYTDIERGESLPTGDLFRQHDRETMLVMVGDACMAPWELDLSGGLSWSSTQRTSGRQWLARLAHHFRRSVWLNPEPLRFWNHPTIAAIGSIFPMYPLSAQGLGDAVSRLRQGPSR